MQIKKIRNLAFVALLAGLSTTLYASNGINTDESLEGGASAPQQTPSAANDSGDQIVPTSPIGGASVVPNSPDNQNTATTQQPATGSSYLSYFDVTSFNPFSWFKASKNEEKIAAENNSKPSVATGGNNALPVINEEKLKEYAKKHGRDFDELRNSILNPTPKLATASDTPVVEAISLKIPT